MSICSESAHSKSARRMSAEASSHATGITKLSRVESISVDISTTPRCPFHHLRQEKDISKRQDASDREPIHSDIRARSGAQEESVQCGMSTSVGSGLEESGNVCTISKPASKMKTGVVSGLSKSVSDGTPIRSKRRSLRSERLSIRRFRGGTKVKHRSVSRPKATETELNQETSETSARQSPEAHQNSKRDTEETVPAAETVAYLPDCTLDSVCLTEMELETCRRLDSLARNRQLGRTGGRRAAGTVAKDQNAPPVHKRQPHEVEAKSRLTKVILEPLDLRIESGDLLECSGDRAGRLTYRCDSDAVKLNATAASTEPEAAATDQTTRSTLSSTKDVLRVTESDRRITKENNKGLRSILRPIKVRIRQRPDTRTSDRPSSSKGDESKVVARKDSSPPSSAYVDDASVAMGTNASSSSSSYYDSCSQSSLDGAVVRGLEAMGLESDRGGLAVKKDAMNTASHSNNPDRRSVAPSDFSAADATSDRRRRRVCLEDTPQLSENRPSVKPTGDTRKALAAQTKKNATVFRRRQIVERRNNARLVEDSQKKSLRPVRSSTIIIEPSNLEDTTTNVPKPAKANTCRQLRTNSPPTNNCTFDCVRVIPLDAKLSGAEEVPPRGSSKNTRNDKVTRSLIKPSPTKASELRLRMRISERSQERTSSDQRPIAVDRDVCGSKLSAESSFRHTTRDSYAQLQKVRSIPMEFRLKEICREVVDGKDRKANPDSDDGCSVKLATKGGGSANEDRTTASCVSEMTFKATISTSADSTTVSPDSGDWRVASARAGHSIDACSSKELQLASANASDESVQKEDAKDDERFQGFVGIDLSDSGVKRSTDKSASYREETGRSSLRSRNDGAQEKSFRSTVRTFLVADPGWKRSKPTQLRSMITIQRSQSKAVQNTRRTFLIGQCCVKKIQTRYPRNLKTAVHKLRLLQSLQNTVQDACNQPPSHTILEPQSESPVKTNSPRNEHSSPGDHISPSSPKTFTGSLATSLHPNHPSGPHSDKIPPGQNTRTNSPNSHSNSPVQSLQFCSTPIVGSACRRSPLFFSPIPRLPSPKRPASSLAKSRISSPNTSYTISSSPKTPRNTLLSPLLRYAFPSEKNRESPKKAVSDRPKKVRTKAPAELETLQNLGFSSIVQNHTNNTTSVDDKQSPGFSDVTSEHRDANVSEAGDSSRAKSATTDNSVPTLRCIFYRNHSQPVDAKLPNGRLSRIPQGSWQPFHVIRAGTDVSRFRLRIRYDDIPPRSFRYSKTHRKIIENRLPNCIREVPKLMMLGKAGMKDLGNPVKDY